MAFLPAICRRLLGQELQLPSVRTWWCGQSESLAYVLEHLGELVVRAAMPDNTIQLVHGASLDASQRAELASRIQARPEKYVAQEFVVRSTAPVWHDGTLQPGHVGLRAFAVAAAGSYQVMPGALAHMSSSGQMTGESLFVGQGSKDVWVLSEGPVEPVTLLAPPGAQVAPRRSGNDLPSRVADNLFWLGRHVERAEAAARLLRSIFTRLVSESASLGSPELPALVRALVTRWPQGAVPLDELENNTVSEATALACLYDRTHAGSLHSIVDALARAPLSCATGFR